MKPLSPLCKAALLGLFLFMPTSSQADLFDCLWEGVAPLFDKMRAPRILAVPAWDARELAAIESISNTPYFQRSATVVGKHLRLESLNPLPESLMQKLIMHEGQARSPAEVEQLIRQLKLERYFPFSALAQTYAELCRKATSGRRKPKGSAEAYAQLLRMVEESRKGRDALFARALPLEQLLKRDYLLHEIQNNIHPSNALVRVDNALVFPNGKRVPIVDTKKDGSLLISVPITDIIATQDSVDYQKVSRMLSDKPFMKELRREGVLGKPMPDGRIMLPVDGHHRVSALQTADQSVRIRIYPALQDTSTRESFYYADSPVDYLNFFTLWQAEFSSAAHAQKVDALYDLFQRDEDQARALIYQWYINPRQGLPAIPAAN